MKIIKTISLITLFSTIAISNLAAQEDKNVWVSIGKDAYELISQQKPPGVTFRNTQDEKLSEDARLLQISNSELENLSILMHQKFHRCGGYFVHKSQQEAETFLKNAANVNKLAAHKVSVASYTIDNPEVVSALNSNFNASNMEATVSGLSNFNNRYYTQESGVNAAQWLRSHWQNISANRSDITVELYAHDNWPQASVIATIPGTTNVDEVVVIGGHLDSINRFNPSSGRAPGADDNASGIAVVTETLSAIVASDFRPARTIKIMGYAAEEVGLRGSSEIAQDFSANNVNVVGVAQFDMTGFNGSANDIVFITDFTTQLQTDFMSELLDVYYPEISYDFSQCGYGCSDHASWWSNGFAASFPFEAHFNDSNDAIHTSGDEIFDQQHATNFLKLSLAYVAELAKGTIGIVELATLQFQAGDIEIDEDTSVDILVSRSGDLNTEVSVEFNSQDGSAIAGVDYQAVSGTLTWAAQDDVDKVITIDVNDIDSSKNFAVALSNAQGNSSIGPNSILTINVIAKVDPLPPESETSSSGGGSFVSGLLVFILLLVRQRRLVIKR